eukprot:2821199-Pleurochrysis_carterae.AAC.1
MPARLCSVTPSPATAHPGAQLGRKNHDCYRPTELLDHECPSSYSVFKPARNETCGRSRKSQARRCAPRAYMASARQQINALYFQTSE